MLLSPLIRTQLRRPNVNVYEDREPLQVRRFPKEKRMDWLVFIGVLVVWVALQRFILPKLGIST